MYDRDEPIAADNCYKTTEYSAEIGSVGSKLPLSMQEKSLAELHDTIDQLSRKLVSVLTPVEESESRNELADKEKSQSPLGEQLEANNQRISRASRKIRSLIERLEC